MENTPAKNKIQGLCNNLMTNANMQRALGKNLETFVASISELATNDPNIMKCEPAELAKVCLTAATLHLPINKSLGQAWIVAYNNTVKGPDGRALRNPDGSVAKKVEPAFQIGYKGYIQLALRSGQCRCINADKVYEGELAGIDKLSGMVDLSGDRTSDKIVGYFAYISLINGFSASMYMSVHDMALHAKRYSPSCSRDDVSFLESLANKPEDPNAIKVIGWKGDFNSMAVKTMLRKLLSKYAFMTTEMGVAFSEAVKEDVSEEEPQQAKSYDIQDVQEVEDEPKEITAQPGEQNAAPFAD